jgi:hypothetical protein
VRVSDVSPPPADVGGPAPDAGPPDSAGTWTNGVADAELSVGIGDADGADRLELADTHGEVGNAVVADSVTRRDHGAGQDILPPEVARSLAKQAGIALAEGEGAPVYVVGERNRFGGTFALPVKGDDGTFAAVYGIKGSVKGFWRRRHEAGPRRAESAARRAGGRGRLGAEGERQRARGRGAARRRDSRG